MAEQEQEVATEQEVEQEVEAESSPGCVEGDATETRVSVWNDITLHVWRWTPSGDVK